MTHTDSITRQAFLNSKIHEIWPKWAIQNITIYTCCRTLQNKWRWAPTKYKKLWQIIHTMFPMWPRAWTMIPKIQTHILNFASSIFQTANYMKYGLDKQFKISQYAAAAAPCEINEGVLQRNINKCDRLFVLRSPRNREHKQ